jgi:FtsP/CotA-like multicopper oxidase with cupredoxin domain
MFQSNGKLLFTTNDDDGFYGDVIAVNGRPWPVMKVARRKYRFRILNASVSRGYQWYLDDGSPMTVIGTDGGLMPVPRQVTSLRHGVAERYEVIIDFSRYAPGARVKLRNRSPKNNLRFTNTHEVMAFDVTDEPFDPAGNTIPTKLNPNMRVMKAQESESVADRVFDLKRHNGQWTINGTTWEDVVHSGFSKTLADPEADSVEVWEFRNDSGGWNHPMHIHFVDFRILSRNGRAPKPHERGPKDVVYVGEHERVRVLVPFDYGRGKYMMHCHNLVHEDHDMMAQFEIVNDAYPGDDPFSDRARNLPEDLL